MTPEEAQRLREVFPPSAIGQLPKGGVMLDYVGHAATTDRLLQVDPEWSWEPFALDQNGLPALDGEGNLWIRLTVCGVTRPGVGDGKNAKERIGDAIRNAAMRFGVALDLWAKEDLGANGSQTEALDVMERQKARIQRRAEQAQNLPVESAPPPPAKPITENQRKKMWATAKERGLDEDRVRELIQQVCGPIESTAHIPRDLFDAVLTAIQAEPEPEDQASVYVEQARRAQAARRS